jgi:hypothetical protein
MIDMKWIHLMAYLADKLAIQFDSRLFNTVK